MTSPTRAAAAASTRPGAASPWRMLYAMTWIVVTEFLLGAWRAAPAWVRWPHLLLGVGLVGLAWANARAVKATGAPGRVKRTAQSTISLAAGAAVLGLLLFFDVGAGRTVLGAVTIWGILLVAHVFFAVGVLAEAAAVGTAYDMWEEREFDAATPPGVIPAAK